MNYDKLWLEIYEDLVLSGIDPDEAECQATDDADHEYAEYQADLLHDQLKGN